MPSLFRLLGFSVYFWSNEGEPLEPIHVHIAHTPTKDGTKFWIYSDGTVHLDSNKSNLSDAELRKIKRLLESHYDEIILFWKSYFNVPAVYKDLL